jgi:hypothetical protein
MLSVCINVHLLLAIACTVGWILFTLDVCYQSYVGSQ